MDSVTTRLVEMVYYKIKWAKMNQFTQFAESDYMTAATLDVILKKWK